jgi:HSP20 family protein
MADIQGEMNRLFDWAFGRRGDEGMLESDWAPAVDVFEENDRYHVHVDLPGLKRDDIDVTVQGDVLTVSGEKKRESETKGEDYYRCERYYGKFSRSLTLPTSVDSTKIEAKYKDGVLELSIPKTEQARPKQIKIEV